MAKRELEEINAGSMADIAFLLLIFFLITTTMNTPKAVDERLPQKTPDNMDVPLVNPDNVLSIFASGTGRIMIEEEPAELEDIKDWVIKFYDHPDNAAKLPGYTNRTKSNIEADIKRFEGGVALNDPLTVNFYSDSLKKWEKKLRVATLIGPYRDITDKAMVTIQLHNSTKFSVYLEILDQILMGLNELRDNMCMEKFGKPYRKLKGDVEDDKPLLEAVKQVFPKRIMKAKARNT